MKARLNTLINSPGADFALLVTWHTLSIAWTLQILRPMTVAFADPYFNAHTTPMWVTGFALLMLAIAIAPILAFQMLAKICMVRLNRVLPRGAQIGFPIFRIDNDV
jgi:hypothetical protein